MRIAVLAHLRHPIAPPFMGGMEAHCWHLVRGLAARGHDVTLFASGNSDAGVALVPVLPRHYHADFPDPERTGREALNALLDGAMARTCDRLAQGGFDVVHNNSLHRFPVGLAARGQPCVTSLHVPPFPALHRAVLAQPAARFTAPSRTQIASWWPDGPPPGAVVVPNGIDPKLWPFSPLGNGGLVWAGRITPTKGAHLAAQTAARLGLRMTLYGTIEDRAWFHDAVRPFLAGHIRYGGHVSGPDLARALGEASALLFTPLWDEPFGLAAIEAMATGLPVASLDQGAAREVIGNAGAFAAEPTAQSLAQAVRQALAIPRDRPRLRVERHFTLSGMIQGYEAQYRAAIADLVATPASLSRPA